MYKEILNKKTKHILTKIGQNKVLKDFYLAGGTALALQINHRKSIDLDWFSGKPFSTKRLKEELRKIGSLKVNEEEEGTLNCVLDGVKISFFYYPYKKLFSSVGYEDVKLADIRDIACMKIVAISSRGSKKDFIDIFFLLKEFSLKDLLILFDKKYKGVEYNHVHILKGLTYFEESEKEPMPIMIREINWRDVKKEIKEEVRKLF